MGSTLGRILVVDDNEDDHFQLGRILRGGFQVVPAFSAAEALERLRLETFDVLITDQQMPRMSGDALIERVKADSRQESLRCILLSGRTSDEQLVEILRGGLIYRYFEKNRTLLSQDGRAELLLAARNAVTASQLEQDRLRLTQRLKKQVDALSGQYRLVKKLLSSKDPAQVIRALVESLADQLPCRAAIGLVDLRPSQAIYAHLAFRAHRGPMTAGEATEWERWTCDALAQMSGRTCTEGVTFGRTGALVVGQGVFLPGERVTKVPVFVDRDLCGLLVLAMDADAQLEDDQAELLEVWRNQLQDALTRVHTQRLDEQRRIELMVESMAEGVVLTDESGVVTLMNPAARQMLDLHDVGRSDFSVIVHALGLSSLDVLRQLGVGDSTAAWRALQVGEQYYNVLFTRVRDHSGALVGVLTVVREITAQKKAEQRREEFVHIIGHELRSPLTSIGGVLDLLGKHVLGELNVRQREYVQMARDSCVRINHLLNDLLDLAKFEHGKMPLNLESMALDTTVLDTVHRFQPLAMEKQVKLSFTSDLDLASAYGDPYRLGQVMNNLLSNALKFTPPGGRIEAKVFTSRCAPDLYLVSVHNTGEEIDERDLDRIFDKFEQVARQDRGSVGGTGLGLSICRNIVRGHGGEIWVDSGRGGGTTFVFTLPRAREGVEAAKTESERRTTDQAPVLVVYRDAAEGFGLMANLLALDFNARMARADAATVRARIEQTSPALALVVGLGAEDTEVIDEVASHTDLPIIAIVTVGAEVPQIIDISLEMPIEPIVLSSMLNIVLTRHRQRRRMRALVVDRDPAHALRISEMLETAGYLPFTVDDVKAAPSRIDNLLPDLLLLDLGMPGLAPIIERARADGLPTVLLGDDPAEALAYDLRHQWLPRDAERRQVLLGCRAQMTNRPENERGLLFALPGAQDLQREVHRRIRDTEPYACCAVDISGLRSAVDTFGFVWGHRAMARLADLVHQVLRDNADSRAFLGHLREDDFVFLVAPEHCKPVCDDLSRAFDLLAPLISGTDTERAPLRLQLTVLIDHGGRFERYAALQGALSRARTHQETGRVSIDRLVTSGLRADDSVEIL